MLNNLVDNWKNIKLFFKEFIFFIKDEIMIELRAENNSWKISELLRIIEILDETYSKTKNSLDEYTTFTIWVLRIIG
jgi:hypothetical protein